MIRSAEPEVSPVINANYLAETVDRQTALATMRLARRSMAQPAIAPFVVAEIAPGPQADSDEAIPRLC